MAVGEKQPPGIFPLDTLRNSKPTEKEGQLYRWRGRVRLWPNGPRVNITIEAQETAIDTGNGSFSITLTHGRGRSQVTEAWAVLSNVKSPDPKNEGVPKTPLLDLYLQRATKPSLLLPQVDMATKIARIYPKTVQLFSTFQDKFDVKDVMGVLTAINQVTRSIASRNNQAPL